MHKSTADDLRRIREAETQEALGTIMRELDARVMDLTHGEKLALGEACNQRQTELSGLPPEEKRQSIDNFRRAMARRRGEG